MWVTFSNTKWIYPTKGEEQHTTRIPVRDIIYFEGIKNDSFIKVTTKNGVFLYQSEFPELEEKFRLFGFGICSRGIMVNFEKVREMKTQELILKNGEKLPLSRRRSVDFREKMAEFFYSSMGGECIK